MACEIFSLDDSSIIEDVKNILEKPQLSNETVRFAKPGEPLLPIKTALEYAYHKELFASIITDNKVLGECKTDPSTIFVEMEPQVNLFYTNIKCYKLCV